MQAERLKISGRDLFGVCRSISPEEETAPHTTSRALILNYKANDKEGGWAICILLYTTIYLHWSRIARINPCLLMCVDLQGVLPSFGKQPDSKLTKHR